MNLAFSIVESSSQVMENTEGLKLILEPLQGHYGGEEKECRGRWEVERNLPRNFFSTLRN